VCGQDLSLLRQRQRQIELHDCLEGCELLGRRVHAGGDLDEALSSKISPWFRLSSFVCGQSFSFISAKEFFSKKKITSLLFHHKLMEKISYVRTSCY
jgi:hypothetical protein